MTPPLFLRVSSLACAAAAILAGGCSTTPNSAPPPAAAAVAPAAIGALKALDYSGNQEALAALDREIAAAAADRTKVSALVAQLIDILQQPAVTFTAQQAIGQRLGALLPRLAANDPALTTLAPWLGDERLANVARLALEPVPGAAVDAAFLQALNDPASGSRLALVQSVGNRRIARAVPTVAGLIKSGDVAVSRAAVKALGQIATDDALAALTATPNPAARTIVEARLAVAAQLPPADGAAEFRRIQDDARIAATQRVLAFRGVIAREPATAAPSIISALKGEDAARKRVALEAISAVPPGALVPSLLGQLDSFDGATRAAVIAALGHVGDATAVPVVAKSLADADGVVRLAALATLGALPGNRDVTLQLARFIATASGDEAKLARQSLARLNGPGVNATVVAAAEQGDAPVRLVMLEAIAARDLTEALPLLWKLRADADGAVRAAALRSLGDIAPASDQAAMLAWTTAATDSQEIMRAQRALISISLRHHDLAARDRLITDAIDHGTPDVQLRLLPVLPRLGSTAAADCAGRLSRVSATQVAAAATAALARWPGRAALPVLIATAEQSTLPAVRLAAAKGAIGFIASRRDVPAAESPDEVARLFAVTSDLETRKSLLLLLSRGASAKALALAEQAQADPQLADDARDAALAIRTNQAWPPVVTASAATDRIGRAVDGKLNTAWSAIAIAGQWVQIDCRQTRPIRHLTLDQSGHAGDFPGPIDVYVTDDPAQPGAVRVATSGRRDKTVIDLPAGLHGRYVIIRTTAKRPNGNWAISEIRIE
jgi:HEAT repeat protein